MSHNLRTVVLGIFSLSLAMAAGISMFSSKDACAVTFAESSCDPDYRKSLEARAWLEAQREITQNQNLIFKSDSVLEYTCFDKHLNQIAQLSEELFSESDRWGTPPASIQEALGPIAVANQAYNEANYLHNYLGGRMGTDDPDSSTDDNINYQMSGEITPDEYTCNVMNQIWQQAKCMDFIVNEDTDGFYTFQDYHEAEDMRRLPQACGADVTGPSGPDVGEHTADFWQNMALATGGIDADEDGEVEFGEGTEWSEDRVETYFYLFDRGDDGDICGNAIDVEEGLYRKSKVKTGLIITRDNQEPYVYEEFICLVPGCFYVPTEEYSASDDDDEDDGLCCLPTGPGADDYTCSD